MRALGLQRQRLLEDQRRRRGLQCRERTGRPVAHRHCLLGILYVLCNDIAWQLLPLELRFGSGQTCWRRLERWQQAGVFDQLHRILLAEPNAAGRPPRLVEGLRGRFSHPREKRGGADTGPSPVDRRKTGSKHHLICDGRGTPLKVITTAANDNDVTQTLALVDGIPPVAGRPGRPRTRPEAVLGDKGYDSNANRDELRKRRILPVISRQGAPNIQGMGKLRNVVEQTFALLHHFKRLTLRWERRTALHDAFASPACSLICWRRFNRPVS
ncbi:IS5 family transposase [Streptomyces spectabilis]|uniref:IS5 family transposase n=2 Tax=Streptomyces spectabilis TaxID=68270 RepID=UPI001E4A65AF|nr:IS5 family transposase [Streptomyces spectabilis]MCI3899876.1 IS5 family transposase [Streptomyces spectabilis]